MTRYIEYYEINDRPWYGVEEIEPGIYFMPMNKDAFDKANLDSASSRIWRLDTRSDRVWYVMVDQLRRVHPIEDHWKHLDVDKTEFFKLQLQAKPVPYSFEYTARKEREAREQQKAKR